MKTRILMLPFAFGLCLTVLCGCSREARIQRALSKAEGFQAADRNDVLELTYLGVLRLDPNQPRAIAGLAELYMAQGRWLSAMSMLVRVRDVTPDDAERRADLAMLMFLGGDVEAAREESLEVLERQPTNKEAILVLATTCLTSNQVTDARDKLHEIQAIHGPLGIFHLAEAAFLLRESRLTEAEATARLAIQADPSSAVVYMILSNILKIAGRQPEAREALRQSFELAELRSPRKLLWPKELIANDELESAKTLLVEMQDQAPDFLPVPLLLAELCLRQGQLRESESWIEQILNLAPSNPEVLLLQAQVRIEEQEYDRARALLARLGEEFPDSLRINYELARANYLAGDIPGALSVLERLVYSHPDSVPVRLLLGQVYLVRNDPKSAVRVVAPLLQVDPNYRRALLLLAEAQARRGELTEAVTIYQRLVLANPEDIEAMIRLAQVQLIQGNPAEARRLLEGVMRLDSSNLPAMALLADLDVREQDLDAAASRLVAQVEQNPTSVGPRFLLGQVYYAQQKYEAAEVKFRETIQLAPTFQPAYLLLVRSYSASGRSEDARAELEALLRIHPQDTAALLLLATMAEAGGEADRARRLYDKVLIIDPKNLMALNNLAFMQLGPAGDLDQALELASRARKLAPQVGSVADTFGWVLFHRREYARAVMMLREAAIRRGSNPEVLYHLGMAAYMNGEEGLARRSFEQVMQLDPSAPFMDEIELRLAILDNPLGEADEPMVEQLRQALVRYPSDPVALKRLAAWYQKEGRVEKVIQLYQAALAQGDPSVPVLIQYAMVCLEVLNDQDQAMLLARSARRLAPQDPEVAYTLGRLAYQAGDHVWAASLLGESSDLLAEVGKVNFDAALAFYSVGRLEEARETMERARAFAADDIDEVRVSAFLDMLAFHHSLDDPHAARQAASAILKITPQDMPATMVCGLAAQALKQADEAERAYHKVLQSFPGFAPALKQLSLLNAEQLGNDEAAFELGLQARESLPDDPELNRMLGILAYRQGDYSLSVQLLGETRLLDPHNPEVLYCLGLARLEAGQVQQGQHALAQALEYAPDHALSEQAREALNQR